MKIDNQERQILRELQLDGRLSNVDLARRAHLSESPCLRKTRALEESGVIAGYRAIVDPEKLGFALSAYVRVSLDQRSETDRREFFSAVQHEPGILECSAIAGPGDLMLKLIARDRDDLARLTMDSLLRHASVRELTTSLVLRQIKAQAPVPT